MVTPDEDLDARFEAAWALAEEALEEREREDEADAYDAWSRDPQAQDEEGE